MIFQERKTEDDARLLNQFNDRNNLAFSKIYLLYYNDLHYFASNLFKGTEVVASDVIQDIFLSLWENKRQKFDELINIKAYLFISTRNSFRGYIRHNKHIQKHQKYVSRDNDFFVSQVFETELFSFINESVNLLPEECAKVIKEYLKGLDIKEIAGKLNKSEYTVYKQKKYAIDILKKKLSKDKLFILTILIS